MAFDPNTIIGQVWGLVYGFILTIVNAIGGALSSVISNVSGNFNYILTQWARSVASYGLWSFAVGAISLSITFVIAYFMMTVVDAVRDITQVESEL
jgi:ABC-type sulfate transport system permease subunit